jgi:hypothetical protein
MGVVLYEHERCSEFVFWYFACIRVIDDGTR